MTKSLAQLQAEFDENVRNIRAVKQPRMPEFDAKEAAQKEKLRKALDEEMPQVMKDIFGEFDKQPLAGV